MKVFFIRYGALSLKKFLHPNLKPSYARFATSASGSKPEAAKVLNLGVPKEIFPEEQRVSITPSVSF